MTRAGSKARRWPDLLIGLLVLLLLGGFGALLLGQRSQPLAGVPAQTTPPATGEATEETTDPITIPSAPGTDGTTTGATGTQAGTEATQGTNQTDTSTGTGGLTEVPAQPIETAPTTPSTDTADSTAPGTTPTPGTTPPASTPAVPPRAGGAVATSEARTPLRSDYRISLGSFATRRTAERLTQGVRDLGYAVYPIDVGEGVVAQVGPFSDEATARQALADIQRAYPGAVVYPPRGRNLRGGGVSEAPAPTAPGASTPSATTAPATTTTPAPSSSSTATAPATSTAPEAGPEAIPSPTPNTSGTPAAGTSTPAPSAGTAPSGPVYLQVGAFDRVESAQKLVAQLRGQGYVPTVNAPEGGKVTVLVGPFSGGALTGAEDKLSASGLDHFRVR